jgi:RecB family exonuclease
MLVFSDLALKYAPWSLSKAQLATNCSFRFNLQYVHKTKATEPVRSAAGRIGNAAHEALEQYLKVPDHDPAKLKRALHKAAVDNELTTPEIDDLLALAHNMVRFRQRLERIKAKLNVTEQLVEKRFGLTRDLEPTGFWNKKDVFFRGVWDLVLRTASGHVAIIDHKSGEPPKSVEDVKQQNRAQLDIYALAALSCFPDMPGVQTALHFIQSEEVLWTTKPPRRADEIREKLVPWYVEFLNRAGAAVPSNEPKKGWYCQFCGYTSICPLKQ